MSMPRDKRLRVVFIDRDGVINRNIDNGYVRTTDDFEILPNVPEALSKLSNAGCQLVVISNQAGVGKGLITKESLDAIDRMMFSAVAKAGGKIAATYYCPHRPDDNCDCRKPAPGLILQASRDLGIDPKETVFIGDAVSDMLAGRAAGCKTVMVLTGKTTADDAAVLEPAPDYIAADLTAAVDWLLLQSF